MKHRSFKTEQSTAPNWCRHPLPGLPVTAAGWTDHLAVKISHITRRLLALALGLACTVTIPFVAQAGGTMPLKSNVSTHPSQGDMRTIANAQAQLIRTPDGVFVDLETSELTPGHAYTLWIVAINAPQNCAAQPCKATDVMKNTDSVRADIGFGDGSIADTKGHARFAAFQSIGTMPKAWFGGGLEDAGAEIHLVLRDHGALMSGLEHAMLSTFRAGCTDKSVPDSLPATARGDGEVGQNTCANIQLVVFEPDA